MALINISDLTFRYDGSSDNIFENVSFQLDTNWKLGFTGRNGRGKTTFLNLLMGRYEYSGVIQSPVAFDYFPFSVDNPSQNTLDIIDEICDRYERWELNRELSLIGLQEELLYRPFNTLSGGERTKLLLVALFLKENNFLLIDEPTDHLDSAARETVSGYLNARKGFILVSHDRIFLDNCIDHILSINRVGIEVQRGNFSSWQRNRQMQDEYETEQNDTLKKHIKKLSEAARRTSVWSDKVEKTKFGKQSSGLKADRGRVGHKAAKMMKRSKSIEARRQGAIDEKSQLLMNVETQEKLTIKPLDYHSAHLVELDGVSIYYDGKTAVSNLSFTVNRGDRLLLSGGNGSGKTSALKLITGEELSFAGGLHIASGLVISLVSQDTSGLCGDLKTFAAERGIDETLFKAILRKLGFSREQFDKDMSDFSAGQKKKALIAGSLCERAHLYVWDEPLNFIDVLSRIQIEELILAHRPTMLFVEHDEAFAQKIATRRLTLS